ncbi:glycosyltransferase family 2 protein [Candidatus Woesearchaeota archaeon]|nr:glycosyltransferase family 2 protein [Candidatus Woesearchaeota archaeon]
MARTDISVVVPAYNEAENLPILHAELSRTLQRAGKAYELIIVDDGSTDSTLQRLLALQEHDKHIRIIKFRRNFGQTAAFDAGFKAAKGNVIVAMDADLQNDPADIPLLLAKMQEGCDVVSGWRYPRHDPLGKRVVSGFANTFRRWLTNERIHDSGCSLKAYRKECFADLDLYGEMHRYIPALLAWKGFRIGEVKVHHRPRRYGTTKYNMKRLFKGFLDLLFIKFWNDYSTRPIHFFGMLSFAQFSLAGLIFAEQIVKAVVINALNLGPLFLLGSVLFITGMLTLTFGFLAEILIRTYYKGKSNYAIEKIYE